MTRPINRQSIQLPTTRLDESAWLHTAYRGRTPRCDAGARPQTWPSLPQRASRSEFDRDRGSHTRIAVRDTAAQIPITT